MHTSSGAINLISDSHASRYNFGTLEGTLRSVPKVSPDSRSGLGRIGTPGPGLPGLVFVRFVAAREEVFVRIGREEDFPELLVSSLIDFPELFAPVRLAFFF